jgi:hypothetical protein
MTIGNANLGAARFVLPHHVRLDLGLRRKIRMKAASLLRFFAAPPFSVRELITDCLLS